MTTIFIILGVLFAFYLGVCVGRWFGKPYQDSGFYKNVRKINRSIGYSAALMDAHALGLHWQIIKRLEWARTQREKLEDWPAEKPTPVPDLTQN